MIHVFLHSLYADWEIGYILPELIEARRQVKTFGLTREPVKSLGGLTVVPDTTLAELDRAEISALILPGGDFWPEFKDAAIAELIHSLIPRGVTVAGICAASGYLGRIGVLDGRPHTSNSLEYLKYFAPDYKGAELYQRRPAVTGGSVVTASGLGAVEFTYELLKKLEVYDAGGCDKWYEAYRFAGSP